MGRLIPGLGLNLRAWRVLCRAALAAILLLPLYGAGSEEPIDEDLERRIKAVFLYRFPEFINWEPAATTADGSFVIDVVGGCSIADELRQVALGHPLLGRSVEVRQVQDSRSLGAADIVFICDGQPNRLKQIIQAAPAKALVVTESPGALSAGSVINFVLSDYRVRFEISLAAARRRGLRVSSRLLDVALAVKKDR